MIALIIVLAVAIIAGLARFNLAHRGCRGWLRLVVDTVCLLIPSVGIVTTLPTSINMQVLLAYLVVCLAVTALLNFRMRGRNKTPREPDLAPGRTNGTFPGAPRQAPAELQAMNVGHQHQPAPPAWYPDPSVPGSLRYWDGSQWTGHTHPASGRAGDPGAGDAGTGQPP